MRTKLSACLAAITAVSTLHTSGALAGIPFPTRQTPASIDRGLLDPAAAATPVTVTLALKLRDRAGAERLLNRVGTRGDPLYRTYLTPGQFAAKFGPTAADIDAVRSYFAPLHVKVEQTSATTLHLTGLPASFETAFHVTLHQFAVPASGSSPAYIYRAPMELPTMPTAISTSALTVLGLDTRPTFRPNNLRSPAALHAASVAAAGAATTPPDNPGSWTVTDFADYYDVTPLYTAKIKGTGQTIGIVTLASFTPSDAFTYWKKAKLTVSKTRITEVQVDGGAGAPSDESGSIETTLDTEQSGGIAPQATILIYEAPNTSQGYLDAFAMAIDANMADAITTSWGSWEFYNNLANSPVTNPTGGKQTSALAATHQLLVQAGVQGESMYAAAGDGAAYDVNRFQLPPDYSLALSVDYPASDAAITAAGGTTVPAMISFSTGQTVDINSEQVWGWDYLVPICQSLGYDPVECGILPVGGGGGISVLNKVPTYQMGVAGVLKSQPDQVLLDEDFVPPQTVDALANGFAGRNVPDVAMNADPDTGYVIGYTSSGGGGYMVYDYEGGTSFVAPQLCGITQLLNQNAGKRIGLLNTAIYGLAAKGSSTALRTITAGDNEYFAATAGYSPAAGLGALDVANLAAATK